MPSLPPVSAKVIADIENYVANLKKAVAATKSNASEIDREVDRLAKGVAKKFSTADIGKDVLRGLGIGSGFALAEQAASKIVEYYEKAAEAQKKIEASVERQMNATLAMLKARRTDEQDLLEMQKDALRIQRTIEELKNPTVTQQFNDGSQTVTKTSRREMTDDEKQRVVDLTAEWQELDKTIRDAQAKMTAKATDTWIQELTEQMRAQVQAAKEDRKEMAGLQLDFTKPIAAMTAAMQRQDEETEKLAEGFRLLVSPSREYMQQIDQVNGLLAVNKLTADEASAALDILRNKAIDAELSGFFSDIDERSKRDIESLNKLKSAGEEFQKAMAQMWNDVSDRAGQSFADIVLTGKASFGDLASIVARSMIEIAARLTIINPLLNIGMSFLPGFAALPAAWGAGAAAAGAGASAGVGAFTGTIGHTSLSLIPGQAAGGRRGPGDLGLVGENGPELFVSDRAGAVLSNSRTRKMLGASGDTYHFNYNFATGVQRAELLPILRAQEQHTLAAMRDLQRRGKA